MQCWFAPLEQTEIPKYQGESAEIEQRAGEAPFATIHGGNQNEGADYEMRVGGDAGL